MFSSLQLITTLHFCLRRFVAFCPVSNRERGVPWHNLIAFNSDNASVMKGRHNSVISRLETSRPGPWLPQPPGPGDLVQLAAGCGIRAAQVPGEDIQVGMYTHFDKR